MKKILFTTILIMFCISLAEAQTTALKSRDTTGTYKEITSNNPLPVTNTTQEVKIDTLIARIQLIEKMLQGVYSYPGINIKNMVPVTDSLPLPYRSASKTLTQGDSIYTVYFQNRWPTGYLKYRSSTTANDSSVVEMYDTVGGTWEIVAVKRLNDEQWVNIISPNPSGGTAITRTYQLPDYRPGTYRIRFINVVTPTRQPSANWVGK